MIAAISFVFRVFFSLGVKLDLSQRTNTLYLRIGCWGKYLDLRRLKWQEGGENCIMRSLIICRPNLPNIFRLIKRVDHVAHTGKMRDVYKSLVWKSLGKRLLGIPRCRWKDNIKMNFRDRGYGLDSSGSGQELVADSCEHGNEPSGSTKAWNFLTFWETISFSKRTLLHGVSYHSVFLTQ
jgi:hypothetical protein